MNSGGSQDGIVCDTLIALNIKEAEHLKAGETTIRYGMDVAEVLLHFHTPRRR